MKLIYRVSLLVSVPWLFSAGIIAIGHEFAGITLDKWWGIADALTPIVGICLTASLVSLFVPTVRSSSNRRSWDKLARQR